MPKSYGFFLNSKAFYPKIKPAKRSLKTKPSPKSSRYHVERPRYYPNPRSTVKKTLSKDIRASQLETLLVKKILW